MTERLVTCGIAVLAAMIFFLPIPPVHAQISANHWNGGAVIIGPSTTDCDSGALGGLRWSSANLTFEMCDGSEWKKLIASTGNGAPPQPDPNVGYFVLSASTHDGNFGGLAGANTLCLDEVTNNDWAGKSDAQSRGLLIGAKVKAWLCARTTCNDLNASQTYRFSVAGDDTMGDATITVGTDSRTHNNIQNWSGSNYFGSATYWTGRDTGTATTFGNWLDSNYSTCQNWGVTGSNSAHSGNSVSAGTSRWYINMSTSCGNSLNFICIVNP